MMFSMKWARNYRDGQGSGYQSNDSLKDFDDVRQIIKSYRAEGNLLCSRLSIGTII